MSDSNIEVSFPQQNGIEVLRPVTKRVPPNMYWGTIKYRTPETAERVNEFLQRLKERGADFSNQEPGHYFYYEIDESGSMVTEAQNYGSRFVKGIAFQYFGDEEEFKREIRALALPYHGDVSISIETYKGEAINNWTK